MAAWGRQTIYIYEMMEHLGIELAGGVVPFLSLSYMTAFHRCESCPLKQECRAWLNSASPAVTQVPQFCPNADILFELQLRSPK